MSVRELTAFLGYFFGKRPSVASVVDRWFQSADRRAALEFYQSWCNKGWLTVRLGDGCHDLTKEGFWSAAWITFVWPPFEVENHLVLATHAEDECGSVTMDKETGDIYYVYDGVPVHLASSFGELLQQLKDAEWHLPSSAAPN